MDSTPRQIFQTANNVYVFQQPWQFVKELGQGAYGCVASARHAHSNETCAVKKVTNVFTKKILTKRCLRELLLLHHFRGHKNITCLYDMDIVFDPPGSGMFNEVYLYEELMEADLHAIIRSKQSLSDAHFQSFIYQTLCGLKYIHSANVLHRDLKPGNLLVNADCELKICDFGLARGFQPGASGDDEQEAPAYMTEYVATRWYRAPEIMLSFAKYNQSIDMWSVGCILAELLGGEPIFKGTDYINQLSLILNCLGTPTEETLNRVASASAQKYIRSLPIMARVRFRKLYPRASDAAIDLLEKLLSFDPTNRPDCAQALEHPYLAVWHDSSEEPTCEVPFDFSFEMEDSTNGMRNLIVNEVKRFRADVRQPIAPLPPAPAPHHALPAAPAAPQTDGAGVGPAFSETANMNQDRDEHPNSALERELAGGIHA
ncbi:hypothetical protein CcaverHIS631_0510960 [Cutaneotrichosporon cavernicola]|nr:hypothetical protein CcaverHIS631_0510960 [Cutaneotrichosporon cavernicola]BEJ09007.1 hypothetical protein CcaverHIS641_0511010 [Cutaneotrichosporon cavernicola]